MAGKDDPIAELKKAVAYLESKVREQDAEIEELQKDLGIEGAIKELNTTIGALPMARLGPVYRFRDGEANAIGELRSSLSRPSFEVLELDFGRTPFSPKPSGNPTSQSRSAT